MRILYNNNCWFINVGEAFIDIGCMHLIRKIFRNAQLVNVSNMNRLYIDSICKREGIPNPYSDEEKMFRMFDYYNGEYFIFAGMYASDTFLNAYVSKGIAKLSKKGVKIIILGLGQEKYTEKETDNFKRYLDEIKPMVIMTRDKITYDHFQDCCPIVDGIDCAFWINEVYDPRNAFNQEYNVITYNRSKEPEELKDVPNVVHAYHMNYGASSRSFKYKFFMSDTPYDYLTLYANAHRVYTDLVHATIAALQYERRVQFCRVDNRGFAIDALDLLQHDSDNFIFIKNEDLEMQKKKVENSLVSLIK